MTNSKLILFLGAGASTPFGYPTTQRFVDELKEELKSKKNHASLGLLNNLLSVPHIKDIEHVLELLKALEVLKEHPLYEFTTKFPTSVNIPMVSTNLPDILRIAENLKNEIQRDIFRQYEFNPRVIDEISSVYQPLIKLISSQRGDSEIPVFTTNYDSVIEQFCLNNGIRCIDGFRKNPESEDLEWRDSEFNRHSRNLTIKLYKLHGSLTWRRRRDYSVVKVGPEEMTDGTKKYSENLLVYPTEKLTREVEERVIPEKEPFGLLHVLFKRAYLAADIIIFIGFNFRDDYLNEIIIPNSQNKKILIVSPHASEITKKIEYPNGQDGPIPLVPNREIVAIDSLFGEQLTIEQISKSL